MARTRSDAVMRDDIVKESARLWPDIDRTRVAQTKRASTPGSSIHGMRWSAPPIPLPWKPSCDKYLEGLAEAMEFHDMSSAAAVCITSERSGQTARTRPE
jgi:hypothetical protein